MLKAPPCGVTVLAVACQRETTSLLDNLLNEGDGSPGHSQEMWLPIEDSLARCKPFEFWCRGHVEPHLNYH